MAELTAGEIYGVARGAGFSPDQAVTFTAIALAESSGRTDALASKGEHSIGLWQVNVAASVRRNTWGDLTDPAVNARAAYEISRSGTSLQPWTVTHARNAGTARDYRRYLDEAQAARASSTATSPASDAQPPTDAPAPANPASTGLVGPDVTGDAPGAATAIDSDHDGVTDHVELEVSRSPLQADGDALGKAGQQAHAEASAKQSDAGQAGGDRQLPADGTSDARDRFLVAAQAQAGDRYVFGAETSSSDTDPDAFDCSELVQWAAQKAGVDVVDGASNQYLTLKEKGMLVPVEQARSIPGALLFSFSSEPQPGGGRPSTAHVAISLGNGNTIEARGRAYGVGEFAVGRRFDYAAVIPGLTEGGAPTPGTAAVAPSYDVIDTGSSPWEVDQDEDGLVDGAEAVAGTKADTADTDRDGISDSAELLVYGTSPLLVDSDANGVDDSTQTAFPSPTAAVGQGVLMPAPFLTGAILVPAEAPTGPDSAELIEEVMT